MKTCGGCLGGLLGLWLMFMVIYIPIYFFVQNNEIDTVRKAGLVDLRLGIMKDAMMTKQAFEVVVDRLARDLKNTTGIDIDESLDNALRKNENISNIEYSSDYLIKEINEQIDEGFQKETAIFRASLKAAAAAQIEREGTVAVTVDFDVKNIGHVQMISLVQARSFWEARFAKYIFTLALSVNGNVKIVDPESPYICGFIGAHVYGFKRTELKDLAGLWELGLRVLSR
jgi:hypothetical protein